MLALLLVQSGLYLLKDPISRLSGLYQGNSALLALDIREILAILGVGVLLGLLGSWFAAARHMRRIEPR
jgi:cell division transport system permease protein